MVTDAVVVGENGAEVGQPVGSGDAQQPGASGAGELEEVREVSVLAGFPRRLRLGRDVGAGVDNVRHPGPEESPS